MNHQLAIISLPDGRKQSENGYLKLLLHFLHEHTIDDLREQTIQDREQFNDRFLSPQRIRRREHCSTFLRCLVENNASKKQLQIVTQLGILRSAIEKAYRVNSVPEFCADSVAKPLEKLYALSIRQIDSIWKWSPEGLDAFEQFGGLYVVLDLLFLDHRLRNLGPGLVISTKLTKIRRAVLSFMNRFIYNRDNVKAMFLKSEVLLTLLADIYRHHCDGSFMRNTIALSFASLASFKGHPVSIDYGPCGIVTSLTETAVASHNGRDHDELKNSLKAIAQLVNRNSGCRVDFLAVDGSMDMLIYLFGDHCEYAWYHPCGRYRYIVFPILFILLLMISLSAIISTVFICLIVAVVCRSINRYQDIDTSKIIFFVIAVFVAIFRRVNTFHETETQKSNRKSELAGNILASISRDLHTSWKALERFRQRDACQLLAKYINSRDNYRGRYLKAIKFISWMIDGHRRRRMGDIEVEKRRLQELKVQETLRIDSVKFKNSQWNFNTILRFLED